jgi:hypothetical protein
MLARLSVVLALGVALFALAPFFFSSDQHAAQVEEESATSIEMKKSGWVFPHSFSAERETSLLDETFAGYVVRSSFGALLEDAQVGGLIEGETNKALGLELLREINEVYEQVREEVGLISQKKKEGGDDFPSSAVLSDARNFDAYSYAQFKVAARRVRGERERLALTQRVGQRLLQMMRELVGVDPSGDPEDLRGMQDSLSKILGAFQSVGYVLDSGTYWPEGVEGDWASQAQRDEGVTFQYWMKDPVILPSARRLFQEEGFAQHFSSRTIESLFAGYLTEAREDEDFDPRDHPDHHVVEQWTLKAAF